jgi:parallel beta-helix repeat protein
MNTGSGRTLWLSFIILVFITSISFFPYATGTSIAQHHMGDESVLCPGKTVRGQTLYVGGNGPNNYSTIQDAVDNASNGDIIFVYEGTYYEHVLITKQVSLIGESREQTIIDGGGPGNVIRIQANGVSVTQFSLQNAGIGAYIVNSSNVSIIRNIITDNWEGIGLLGASHCLISGNLIIHNGFEGINPVQTTFTTISDNSIIDHLQGIYLLQSAGNTISGNVLRSNSRGIEVKESSNNNEIFHNSFYTSEEDNAYDTCSNSWDDGYPSGGNYWDDYHGVDANHDGIGDTPYSIPGGGGNKDYYPLMFAWDHPPWQPSDPYPAHGAINVPINPVLSVFVYDLDQDTMEVSFYDAETQQLIGIDEDVASSTRASVSWTALENDTVYRWYAIADDGTSTTQSETWSFTTGNGTNQPPEAPTISGPTSGKAGQRYDYTFITIDPEGEAVSYYIDWGDSTNSGWIGPNVSGEQIVVAHTWSTRGVYTIKAKAKDVHNAESDWGVLEIKMPKNQINMYSVFAHFFERLVAHFPYAFPVLRYLFNSYSAPR